jgi:hypothetical protein
VPIEQVQLGQRLVGANPLTDDVELDVPDPALARTVVFEATKPDGQIFGKRARHGQPSLLVRRSARLHALRPIARG